MEPTGLLDDVAIALIAALVGGTLAHTLKQPPILGYLAAGLAIGPFTPGYQADSETLHSLAEVGIVFLMFGVGLHFNLSELSPVKRLVIPLATAQIALVALLGTALGGVGGLETTEAVVFGMAISISSTVVLVRALEEHGLTGSRPGRLLVGWLIAQDLATIVMLVLLPVFSGAGERSEAVFTAVRAVLFVVVALAAGPRLVPALFRVVGRTGSRELFVLVVVCLSIGIAVGAELAGASLALGAFIAGVAVSETEGSHQAATDVLPLRDAFAVLFFVSIGMLIDPVALVRDPGLLLLAFAGIMVLKPLVSGVLTAASSLPARAALLAAAGLGQAGEFSFILAEAGRNLGVVHIETYDAILGASALSIAVNPLAFRAVVPVENRMRTQGRLWRWLDRQGEAPDVPPPPQRHVIIAGAGRIGLLAGRALDAIEAPYVYIETSLETVRGLQQRGETAYWGDAGSIEVLHAAGIRHALLLILATPDTDSARMAARHARDLNPNLSVIARGHTQLDLIGLREARVDTVVIPEYEGAVTIVGDALRVLECDELQIENVTEAIRREEYAYPRLPDV